MSTETTRRGLIRGMFGAVAAGALRPRRARASAPDDGLKLGVASYSLRTLSRADAILALGELRVPWVSLKSMHLAYDASPEQIAAARAELAAAGIEIVGGGVVYLQKNDEADVRRYFDYARACGMPLMTIGPTAETLPLIERFVKRYDIAVAIHNHGPEDEHFPSPYEALAAIEGMDPRVGVCIDVGHTARTGVDLVEAVAASGDRLLDLHFKDLRDLRVKESQCVVGEGAMPTAAIFRQLLAMGYDGYVNLEYELDGADPVPGMQRSLAFMRGVLAGLMA